MNPYFNTHFGQFIFLFIKRMGQFLTGNLSLSELASDEIQIFVLGLVALSSALIGVLLVLKKMTMLANSLSHTLLLGIVISYLILIPFIPNAEFHSFGISLKILLFASFITALITSLLTQALTQILRLQEDASVGLVFTTLFALGIVLVTIFTRNAHLGTEAIMGNVDALHLHDLKLVFPITCINLLAIIVCYKEFKITVFDPLFAKSQGYSSYFFSYLLMVLTSATVIGAFRAVGVLLVLAFLVAPAITARLMVYSLSKILFLAGGIGIFVSVIGVAFSRHLLSVYQFPISTAGLVVTILGILYFLCLVGVSLIRRRSV